MVKKLVLLVVRHHDGRIICRLCIDAPKEQASKKIQGGNKF